MSGWLSWLWSAETPPPPQIGISADVLAGALSKLKHIEAPVEKLHILECRPATLSPTANMSLIKRSWLGITNETLMDVIKGLRRTETATHDTFTPRSVVLQELLQTRQRLEPDAE